MPTGRMRRVAAAAASSLVVIALTAGAVLAWVKPSLTAMCADDEAHYAWLITLSQEADYKIQFSWSSTFANLWEVNFGSPGDHEFATDRGGSTLYARWTSDQSKSTSLGANAELCVQPTPAPTASPTPTATPTASPTPTPDNSVDEEPTPEQSVAGSTGTPRPVPDTAMGPIDPAQPTLALPIGFLVFGLLVASYLSLKSKQR